MKFKNIIIIYSLVFLVSCNDFLEEEPFSFLSDANFPETAEDGRIALNGAYSQFWKNRIIGYNNTLYQLSDSDLTSFGTNAYGAGFTTYQAFIRNTADSHPLWVWTDLYEGINSCNFVIDVVQSKGFVGSGGLVAEAKALRAWFYMELINYFGDVPLRLSGTSSASQVNADRTDALVVREQILKDLIESETIMENDASTFAVQNRGGLLTLGAVKMMKIKLYTLMAGSRRTSAGETVPGDQSYWNNVLVTAKEIIDMGIYELEPDFVKLWVDLYTDVYNKETIWEIDFSMPANGNYMSEALTGPGRGPGRAGGYGGHRSTLGFYESYDPQDIRRDWTVNWFYFNPNYETFIRGPQPDNRPFIQKFRKVDDAGVYDGRSPQNAAIYRYADLLLLYAEAINEVNNGPTIDAYNAINAVRYRARPVDHKEDGTVLPDLTNLDYDSFKEAIIDERAWELAFEGHRRMDLIRWGIFMERIEALPDDSYGAPKAANVRPYHMLYPIPQQEMDLNPEWDQNFMW